MKLKLLTLVLFAAALCVGITPAQAQDEAVNNLALGKPVAASSSVQAPPNWNVTNPVDGNRTGGAWSTNDDNGNADDNDEYYVVDLGEAFTIDTVVLYPRVHGNDPLAHFPLDFTISVSTDSVTFTPVSTITDYPAPTDSEGEVFELDPTQARYVRLDFQRERMEGSEYRAQFAEIEIYPFENLALGRPVAASSSVQAPPNWNVTNPVDGNRTGGAWSTNDDNGNADDNDEYYVVDLGEAFTIDTVVLYPRVHGNDPLAHFPLDFTISVSTDSVTFTPVSTITDYPAPTDSEGEVFEFDESSARYVRLDFLRERMQGSEYRAQFAEIEIGLFGESDPTSIEGGSTLPGALHLRGSYPNPFQTRATVRFDALMPATVHVEVYDLLGRRVLSTPERAFAAGLDHRVAIDADGLASGLYLYRVVARTPSGIQAQTGRMTLMR